MLVLPYSIAFFFGLTGAIAAIFFAAKVGLVDVPNARSSHARPTSKGGGIGILAAWMLLAVWFNTPVFFWLPVAIVSFFSVSADRCHVSAKFRLFVHLLISLVIAIGCFGLPFGVLPLLVVVGAVLFLAGTANYYNFMDGIDGIAGITAVVGFLLLAWWAEVVSDAPPYAVKIVIGMVVATLGFLPFNFPRARVFMGDVGSILLGFAFAALVIHLARDFKDFIIMCGFLFPFYADELCTAIFRLRDGQNLMAPHRRHFYQILCNQKKLSHWSVSLGYGVAQLAIGSACIAMRDISLFSIVFMLGLSFIAFFCVNWYAHARWE